MDLHRASPDDRKWLVDFLYRYELWFCPRSKDGRHRFTIHMVDRGYNRHPGQTFSSALPELYCTSCGILSGDGKDRGLLFVPGAKVNLDSWPKVKYETGLR